MGWGCGGGCGGVNNKNDLCLCSLSQLIYYVGRRGRGQQINKIKNDLCLCLLSQLYYQTVSALCAFLNNSQSVISVFVSLVDIHRPANRDGYIRAIRTPSHQVRSKIWSLRRRGLGRNEVE